MSAHPVTRITPEEYLAADRAADFKSEYYDGLMYAMASGKAVHSAIIWNVTAGLHQALRERPCIVYPTELRLRVSPAGLYTYPDVMVVCGEPSFADDQNDTLLNPTLIVEVLLPSTEAHDRGFKFAQYRKLESLREYVLVAQTEPRVEKFLRHSMGQWVLSEHKGLEAVCHLESTGCQIPLAEVYYKIPFNSYSRPE